MDAVTRQLVRVRAGERCEYCRLPQSAAHFFTFHIEHIVARQHIINDSLDNLALACPDCNRSKGPNLSTISLESGKLVRLFHPREDIWEEHFESRGAILIGRTPIGEATIRLLQMNSEERVEMRAELLAAGEQF